MPEEVQPTAPQLQVTTGTKPHDWKKVSLTILVILVVAGLIVAAYWVLVLNKSSDNSDLLGPVPKVTTKTSTESAKEATESAEKDETASWKTYEFEFEGQKYSFKHPKEWVVTKESNEATVNYWVDYEVTKGQNKVKFRSERAYGYGDGDSSDETVKEVTVRFNEKEVKANEVTGNYYSLTYLVVPQDIIFTGFKFQFEISSQKPNLTGIEKKEMFNIVESFKLEK